MRGRGDHQNGKDIECGGSGEGQCIPHLYSSIRRISGRSRTRQTVRALSDPDVFRIVILVQEQCVHQRHETSRAKHPGEPVLGSREVDKQLGFMTRP